MKTLQIVNNLRAQLSAELSHRSVVRHHQYPSRANSWHAVRVLLTAVAPAITLFPFLTLRSMVKRKLSILVLATEGEFGPFVSLMEHLRGRIDMLNRTNLIFILGRHRHAFCDIYETELGCTIVTGKGCWQIIQQALLLQPPWSVEFHRLTHMDIQSIAPTPIKQTKQEELQSAQLLKSQEIGRAHV